MNSQPVVPTLEDPSQLTLLDLSDLVPLGPKKVRPHDKIARLPKVLRDLINSMLDDGVAYRAIADYHCERPAHSFHLSLLRDPTSPLGPAKPGWLMLCSRIQNQKSKIDMGAG